MRKTERERERHVGAELGERKEKKRKEKKRKERKEMIVCKDSCRAGAISGGLIAYGPNSTLLFSSSTFSFFSSLRVIIKIIFHIYL